MTLTGSMKQSGKLVFPPYVRELARRRFKMETLHIQTKKTLTKKTQASEIKKILLIDQDKDSAYQPPLRGKDTISCFAILSKRHGVWFTLIDLISLSSTCVTPIARVYPTFRNVGLWQKTFRSFWPSLLR